MAVLSWAWWTPKPASGPSPHHTLLSLGRVIPSGRWGCVYPQCTRPGATLRAPRARGHVWPCSHAPDLQGWVFGWLVGCAAGLAGGCRAWPAVFPLPCRFPGQDTRPGGPPKAGGNEGRSVSLEQDSVHVPRARASPVSGTPGGRVGGSLPGKEAEPRVCRCPLSARPLPSVLVCPPATGVVVCPPCSERPKFTEAFHFLRSQGLQAVVAQEGEPLCPRPLLAWCHKSPWVPGKGSCWESGRAAQARGGGKPRPGPGLVTVTPPRPSGPVRPGLGSGPSPASVRSESPLPALTRQVVCTLDVSTEPQYPRPRRAGRRLEPCRDQSGHF